MKLFDCAPTGAKEYQNPILRMDLSDPDVIRVGEDYYLVASSFTYLPGVPLYHSRDMVHWRQLSWCVASIPFERYALPAHGAGTWAPAIRYHDGRFYVFVPLPDEGIFVTTATDPAGPWSPLHCVWAGKGWIDPCPFWDDDGNAYMAHAYARSRCGIKHRIDVCRMAPDAMRLLDEGTMVYNDPDKHPTMEGPKLYKREGWYYIFVPAGGVGTGWQTVLRSRSPLGPYEDKIVLHQGKTDINGPHQGAWVDTPDGGDWFYHFQDRGVYGRVLHLQPMTWRDGWPVMGRNQNEEGVGEPVERWSLPLPDKVNDFTLNADDDFSGPQLGLQWQWQANPQQAWYQVGQGLRLAILPCPRGESLLWYMPNVLTQMPQDWAFTMEAAVTLEPQGEGDQAGIAVLGHSYSALALHRGAGGNELRLYRGTVTEQTAEGLAEEELVHTCPWSGDSATLRLHFLEGGQVSYGALAGDGEERPLPGVFPAGQSSWSGAKPALFARSVHNKAGGTGVFHRVEFTR